MSIIQENLLTKIGYTPYCGDMNCAFGMPRTTFNGKQFICKCGWQSLFTEEFILNYKNTWKIK